MNNSVFDDSEDAAIRFRLLKWTVKYLDLGTGGLHHETSLVPVKKELGKVGPFKPKQKSGP